MSSSASFSGARFIRLGPFTVGLFTAEAKVLKVNMAGAVNHLQPRIQPSYSTFTYLLKITILNGWINYFSIFNSYVNVDQSIPECNHQNYWGNSRITQASFNHGPVGEQFEQNDGPRISWRSCWTPCKYQCRERHTIVFFLNMICVYKYIYTYLSIYVCIYIYIYINVNIHIDTQTRMSTLPQSNVAMRNAL